MGRYFSMSLFFLFILDDRLRQAGIHWSPFDDYFVFEGHALPPVRLMDGSDYSNLSKRVWHFPSFKIFFELVVVIF